MVSKYEAISQAESAISQYTDQIRSIAILISEINSAKTDCISQKNSAIQDIVNSILSTLNGNVVANVLELTGIDLNSIINSRQKLLSDYNFALAIIESTAEYINSSSEFDSMQIDKEIEVSNQDSLSNKLNLIKSNSSFKEVFATLDKRQSKFVGLLNRINGNYVRFENFFVFATEIFGKSITDVQELNLAIDELQADIDIFQTSINAINTRRSNLENLCNQAATAKAYIDSFDTETLECCKNELKSYFSRCQDLLELRKNPNFTSNQKIMVTTIYSLVQKVELFDLQIQNLSKEERDIQQVSSKISNVKSKWRRSSKSYINGDKSKWLVEGPKNRQKRVTRLTTSSRTVYSSSYLFNDYNAYDNYIEINPTLPFWYVGLESANDKVNNQMLQDLVPDFDSNINFDLGNQELDTLDSNNFNYDDLQAGSDAFDSFVENANELTDDLIQSDEINDTITDQS
jgi:hypothetical protein